MGITVGRCGIMRHAMSFFEGLQNSAFTEWFLGSESIWTYPTVLTLHTMGLAVLVGASAILHLRVIGVGAAVPLTRLRPLYSLIWPAFLVNLATGLVLFVTQAADRVTQPLFYMKLASIGAALWVGMWTRRHVFDRPDGDVVSRTAAIMASGGLVLWCVAIVTGRLMAYFTGR